MCWADLRDIEIKRAVLKLAQGRGEDPTKPLLDRSKEAEAIANKYPLEETSRVFRPKSKLGIGIGGLPSAGHKDGIELLLRDYALKAPTAAEVTKYNDDLLQVARITLAMSEVMPYYAPKQDKGPATAVNWRTFSAAMKRGSQDFLDAVGAKDNQKIAAAAKQLNNTCATCHNVFR